MQFIIVSCIVHLVAVNVKGSAGVQPRRCSSAFLTSGESPTVYIQLPTHQSTGKVWQSSPLSYYYTINPSAGLTPLSYPCKKIESRSLFHGKSDIVPSACVKLSLTLCALLALDAKTFIYLILQFLFIVSELVLLI